MLMQDRKNRSINIPISDLSTGSKGWESLVRQPPTIRTIPHFLDLKRWVQVAPHKHRRVDYSRLAFRLWTDVTTKTAWNVL